MFVGDVATLDVNDETDEMDDGADGGLCYWDDRTSEKLDAGRVREARREEIEFMKSIPLYEEVDRQEAWDRTGKAPISTRWVDINRGTAESPDVRCRLVARDFKPKGEKDRWGLFAAMPPLEAKKILLRTAGNQWHDARRRGDGQYMKLLFVDAKKAHLNGVVRDDEFVYIELPPEACTSGASGVFHTASSGKWAA